MPPRHLYIHVPFCARRCSYCDFSIAVRRTVPVEEYLRSLRQELASMQSRVSPSAVTAESEPAVPLDTVYMGGGTPSRLGGAGIRDLLSLVREFYLLSQDAEITLEANPEDVSGSSVEAWANAGVNRISLGVQTFDDVALQWMHRTHTAAQSVEAVGCARRGGIDNISVDLIFALPAALARSWKADVDRALELSPSHVSLYGLTVEPATPLGRWTTRGLVQTTPEETYADEFLYAHGAATAAGMLHYEVSNFALPGYRSRHNSAYWSGVSYAGVGPSAHSFDGSVRHWNTSAFAEWSARLEAGLSVIAGNETLTVANRSAESVYLGLRTTDGLLVEGQDVDVAGGWVSHGWATVEDSRVRLTPEGWLRLDSLAAGLTGI